MYNTAAHAGSAGYDHTELCQEDLFLPEDQLEDQASDVGVDDVAGNNPVPETLDTERAVC